MLAPRGGWPMAQTRCPDLPRQGARRKGRRGGPLGLGRLPAAAAQCGRGSAELSRRRQWRQRQPNAVSVGERLLRRVLAPPRRGSAAETRRWWKPALRQPARFTRVRFPFDALSVSRRDIEGAARVTGCTQGCRQSSCRWRRAWHCHRGAVAWSGWSFAQSRWSWRLLLELGRQVAQRLEGGRGQRRGHRRRRGLYGRCRPSNAAPLASAAGTIAALVHCAWRQSSHGEGNGAKVRSPGSSQRTSRALERGRRFRRAERRNANALRLRRREGPRPLQQGAPCPTGISRCRQGAYRRPKGGGRLLGRRR
mmetsp:Transcript_12850/g.34502  ORF Transcript_12850/g.34502 Transcript_12850/m.34502 type:complete len:308 (+) Transcript_12850:898-1821(+)